MNPRIVAILQTTMLVLAAAFVGVLAKLALFDVPPFTFVWLQIGIGGLFLTLYTLGVRGERVPRGLARDQWLMIIWIGLSNFTLGRVVFMLSLERLPVITYTYLLNFVGVVTMGMSVIFLRERPSLVQIVGAVLALVGLRFFFREIPPPSEMVGVILLAIGVLALASTNIAVRRLVRIGDERLSNTMIACAAVWIGGLPVVLAGLLTDWPPPVGGTRNWAIISMSGFVTVAFGLAVWSVVLRTLRSYEASILAASGVIWTALFAIPILGERLDLYQIVGIVMMLIGLTLAQIRRARRATPATPSPEGVD